MIITSRAWLLAPLVLASLLLTGCASSDGGSAPTTSSQSTPTSSTKTDASQKAGESPPKSTPPTSGQVGSKECQLEGDRLAFVVRDWTRVAGSIGREDHDRYTGAFVSELDDVASQAGACSGAADFKAFLADARKIDDAVGSSSPDFDLYKSASNAGNRWLQAVGLGNNALSVG